MCCPLREIDAYAHLFSFNAVNLYYELLKVADTRNNILEYIVSTIQQLFSAHQVTQ